MADNQLTPMMKSLWQWWRGETFTNECQTLFTIHPL